MPGFSQRTCQQFITVLQWLHFSSMEISQQRLGSSPPCLDLRVFVSNSKSTMSFFCWLHFFTDKKNHGRGLHQILHWSFCFTNPPKQYVQNKLASLSVILLFPDFFCDILFQNNLTLFFAIFFGKFGPYQGRIGAVSGPYQSRIRAVSEPYQGRIGAVSEPYQSRVKAVSGPYQGRIRAVSEPYQSRIRAVSGQKLKIYHFFPGGLFFLCFQLFSLFFSLHLIFIYALWGNKKGKHATAKH